MSRTSTDQRGGDLLPARCLDPADGQARPDRLVWKGPYDARVLDESLTVAARSEGIEKHVVGAVVHHAGAVLLLTRSVNDTFLPGIEELPSGGVEDGETLAEALDRELLEEVGFSAGTVEPGFLATFDYVSGSGRLTRQFTVSVPLNDRAVVLSDEHSAYRWVNCSEIDRSSATAKTQGVVAAWFDWDQAENRRA